MGTLTKAEMRTELYLLLNSRDEVDPNDTTGQVRLDRFLNWSYARVQLPSTFEHVEKQTTQTLTLVASTSSYTTTVWAIDHILYSNRSKRLTPLSRAQLSNISIPSGPPSRFARWGPTVYLDTIPTSTEAGHTLVVYGWEDIQTLSGTGAASALNSLWDQVIVTGAAWHGWRSLGDMARADLYREEYAAMVNDARSVFSIEGHIPGWRVEIGTRTEYQ